MSKLEQAKQAFSFDDFILVPQYSKIKSRKDPDISVKVPGFEYKIPIVSAPMNTVTEEDMLVTMGQLGGVGVLHRYMSIENQVKISKAAATRLSDAGVEDPQLHIYVAVGANGDSEERIQALAEAGFTNFCVDVANGHNELSVQAVRAIKKAVPNASVMAGNICTFDGAHRLAEAGATSIRVGIGPGCFAAGTRILMSNGTYKNIEKVQPGDRVINKDGNPVTVKNAWCTGIKKVLGLRHTQFHKKTYCTTDHKFWTGNLTRTSKNSVSSRGFAKSLNESDIGWQEIGKIERAVLTLPENISFEMPKSFEVKLQKRNSGNRKNNIVYKTDSILSDSYDTGYIFGTFLGDGSSHTSEYQRSKRGSVHWTFGKDEIDIAKKLRGAIDKSLNKKATISVKKNTIILSLYYKPLADYLDSFGKRSDKHLPENLIVDNKDYLLGLHDGLIDSDGHRESKSNRLGFTNTSERLIELFSVVEFLLNGKFPNSRSRGICTSKLVKNAKESFVSRRLKAAHKRAAFGLQLVKILAAEQSHLEVPVYDIEVACPTHSFIANNAIVHNSVCTTRQVTGHGVPQLSAIEDCVRIKTKQFIGFSKRVATNSPEEYTKAFPDVAIIADGGVKKSGDIIKALAIGADAVMIGSLLAGTEETPGDYIEEDGRLYKYYYGMASEAGRQQWFDKTKVGLPSEGVAKKVPYLGRRAIKVIDGLCQSVKVGLSYSGANNIAELQERAEWRRITEAGYVEGTPHGKQLK